MSEAIKVVGRPWRPGESGNPNGRPVGARGRFSERFVSDICDAWHKYGAAIVERMATEEPIRFAELCARLIPKDVQLTLQTRLPGNLEAEEWSALLELLGAVRTALPGDRKPGEIAALVTEALRLHSAKLIEQG
jgi:hypothetical protein